MKTYCIYGILIYLAAVNLVAFFLYGIDKWKARHDKWRVTEARLIGIALAGGSIGAMLGMKVWHHKTQHKKFSFGLPFILILQIAAVVIIFHLLEKWSCL